MLRIIDGQVFEGKRSEDRWTVTVHELGNDQREAIVQRCIDWVDAGPLDPNSIEGQIRAGLRERDPAEVEARLEANRKRAARRAKTRVRRLCKALGLDCMMTMTYRALVTDLALCKRHMKEFVRRIKREIPGFVYVAAFEEQKRGAWHIHMAVRKVQPSFIKQGIRVKSYDLVRAIWRRITGELGGTVNIGKDKPWKRYSPGRLAAYLSKYMLKAFEAGDDWSNRYSGSAAGVVPKAVKFEMNGRTLAELIDSAYACVCIGGCDTFTWLSRFGDVFYISTEPEGEHKLREWEI